MSLLTDPAFWIAVTLWILLVALVMCLMVAGARDDRQLERAERSRQDTQDRAAAEREFPRRVGGWRR